MLILAKILGKPGLVAERNIIGNIWTKLGNGVDIEMIIVGTKNQFNVGNALLADDNDIYGWEGCNRTRRLGVPRWTQTLEGGAPQVSRIIAIMYL